MSGSTLRHLLATVLRHLASVIDPPRKLDENDQVLMTAGVQVPCTEQEDLAVAWAIEMAQLQNHVALHRAMNPTRQNEVPS